MESVDKEENKKTESAIPKSVIHSKTIRAGKRTYFFDVKSTRNNEYYLTITESKKKYNENGKFHYEKHKVFLYPEDFQKFTDALNEVVEFIDENQPELHLVGSEAEPMVKLVSEAGPDQKEPEQQEEITADIESENADKGFSDVRFEDI